MAENTKTFQEAWDEMVEAVTGATKQLTESFKDAGEQIRLAMQCKMRRFYLICHVDDVLGDIIIAEGVVFEDGAVSTRFKNACVVTMNYHSMEELLSEIDSADVTVKFIDAEKAS